MLFRTEVRKFVGSVYDADSGVVGAACVMVTVAAMSSVETTEICAKEVLRPERRVVNKIADTGVCMIALGGHKRQSLFA